MQERIHQLCFHVPNLSLTLTWSLYSVLLATFKCLMGFCVILFSTFLYMFASEVRNCGRKLSTYNAMEESEEIL